jgi:hypothetical protein
VKVTAWPGARSSNLVPLQAERWKKYSVPSGVAMNPNPLSVVRFTVPRVLAMLRSLSKKLEVAGLDTLMRNGSAVCAGDQTRLDPTKKP